MAWQVQRAGEEHRVAAGATLAGWKVGYASEALRQEMGIAEPNYGPLYADMLMVSGAPAGPGLGQPRVEPEIALVLGADVDPGQVVGHSEDAADRVLSRAVAEACIGLEVVDSVWSSYAFTWEENTADGSSAARIVLGERLPSGIDLANVSVEARHADRDGTGTTYAGHSRAAMGHPMAVLRWLVEALALEGRQLRAGDVVMTGGLTPTLPLTAGSMVSARFEATGWTGSVEVTG